MGLWDMLSTTPKEKMRKRSTTPNPPNPAPLFGNGDEPTSVAIVAEQLESEEAKQLKLETPNTPSPALTKRKNMDGPKDEGSKRLRSGTIVNKNSTAGSSTTANNGTSNGKALDFPEPQPHLSSSQFSIRSPTASRLSQSVSRPSSMLEYPVVELDNGRIEALRAARMAADKAEQSARNELQLAHVARLDRQGHKLDVETDLAAKDDEIAELQERLEECRRERDKIADRLNHAQGHLTAAENHFSECSRNVHATTAAAKAAEREYTLALRGE